MKQVFAEKYHCLKDMRASVDDSKNNIRKGYCRCYGYNHMASAAVQEKTMEELFAELNRKALNIVNIMLADIILDVDFLTVALCAGNFGEIEKTIFMSDEGENGYIAAHRALDLGWKPEVREQRVQAGYFASGLRGLIDLAKQNPDAGSRLMPVFAEMVSDPEKYGLSTKLVHETVCYMEHIRQRDGFAIANITNDGKVVLCAARNIFDD